MSRLRKSLKISAIVVGVCLLVVFGCSIWVYHHIFGGQAESGRHVAHVDWLPAEATDVTFQKNDGLFWFLSFECALPRPAFDKFAKEKGWSLVEKRDYTTGLRFGLGLPPVRNVGGKLDDTYTTALVYEDRRANGGGVTVVYDPERQRLFVLESGN